MSELFSILDSIYEEIVITIALGTGGIVIAYVRGILKREKQNSFDIVKINKRLWRMERSFILSLKLQAKLTRKAHGDEPEIISDVEEIEDLVNVILKDDLEEE